MPPRPPEGSVHRLPPILRTQRRNAAAGCSKGAWGLFVLSRVIGILTDTPISPSPWRRQRPSRYAIRAGRNLPDKEFRYLRTVIVTAAVYRGFGSELRAPEGTLTPPLNLPAPGRRQWLYRVLLDFAATCVFAKQSLGPILCGPPELGVAWTPHPGRLPFSRSYGDMLPSSFSTDHSSTLGFSPRLPVSVCGTVGAYTPARGFSWRPASRTLDRLGLHSASGLTSKWRDLPPHPGYAVASGRPAPDGSSASASPLAVERTRSGTGIFARFPSPTPLGLGLGAG